MWVDPKTFDPGIIFTAVAHNSNNNCMRRRAQLSRMSIRFRPYHTPAVLVANASNILYNTVETDFESGMHY